MDKYRYRQIVKEEKDRSKIENDVNDRRRGRCTCTRSSTHDTPYAYGLIKNAIEAADADGKIMNSRNISLGVEIANEDLEWRSTRSGAPSRLARSPEKSIRPRYIARPTDDFTAYRSMKYQNGLLYATSRMVVNLRWSCTHSRALATRTAAAHTHTRARMLRLRRQRW